METYVSAQAKRKIIILVGRLKKLDWLIYLPNGDNIFSFVDQHLPEGQKKEHP